MDILPGLTSTQKDRIPAFIAALAASGERRIAFFPTCLTKGERKAVYRELERIEGLVIPHVHVRADCDLAEFAYLSETFGTGAFNIHPLNSSHPFEGDCGPFAPRIFVENVDVAVPDEELEGRSGPVPGGICPDFSHLENARLHGRSDYVDQTMAQLRRFRVGCCHLSAVRPGTPNRWNGEWDHHAYERLEDFDYLARYREFLPSEWASLELENSFEEQLEARAHIEGLMRRE